MASEDMDTGGDGYKLSQELTGHEQDVRGIFALPGAGVLSCSRDGTARMWTRGGPEGSYIESATLFGHTKYIGACCYIPATELCPDGALVTVSNDHTGRVYNYNHPAEPILTLIGHEDTVSCVCAGPVATTGGSTLSIVTGSWDKTARVWENGACTAVLQGHEQALWGVLSLNSNTIVTASADKTIRIWHRQGSSWVTDKVVRGHTDCVRGLTPTSQGGFASCSNDGSLRVWDASGNALGELYGHSSFVYSIGEVSSGSSNKLISSSEDRSLRVWNMVSGDAEDIVYHPCNTVWCCVGLDNGDIATGGADGVVRVFTQAPSRIAAEAVRTAFDAKVAACQLHKDKVGDLDKSKLKTSEALQTPGSKQGETKMVKETVDGAEKVFAYTWRGSSWEKIGEVMDAVGKDRKTMLNGKEYDYVFDVDLEDGGPMRRIGYNNGENPWVTAQNWLNQEQLDQRFLPEVAQFITQNTQAMQVGPAPTQSGAGWGEDRYIPGMGNQNNFNSGWGGSNTPTSNTSNSAHHTIGSNAVAPTSAYFPLSQGVAFDSTGDASKIMKKIRTLNNDVAGETKLTDEALNALEKCIESGMSVSIRGVDGKDIGDILAAVIKHWASANVFPFVDILRGVCRSNDFYGFNTMNSELVVYMANTVASTSNSKTSTLFVARCFANMASTVQGTRHLLDAMDVTPQESPSLINFLLAKEIPHINEANVQIAVATVIMNLAAQTMPTPRIKQHLLSAALMLAREAKGEAAFRLLVAVGTLVTQNPSFKSVSIEKDALAIVTMHVDSDTDKVSKCAISLADALK